MGEPRVNTMPSLFGKTPRFKKGGKVKKYADGGQVGWQQFQPGTPEYLGQSGAGVPPWMQNNFGASTAQPGQYQPQTQPGQPQAGATPQGPQGATQSWAQSQASQAQAPAWFENSVPAQGYANGLNQQPLAPESQPSMPTAGSGIPDIPSVQAPASAPTQPPAMPQTAAPAARAAVSAGVPQAPPAASPSPAEQPMQAQPSYVPPPPAYSAPQPQQSAPSYAAQSAPDVSQPAPQAPAQAAPASSPPTWSAPPADLGYDPQQQPGAYGYINPATGSPLANYTMGPTGSITYVGNNPAGEGAAANYGAVPQTDPSTLGYDPQSQPGSYGYVNPSTGATMPNYSMDASGSVTQNFPGYAKGGAVPRYKLAGGGGLSALAAQGQGGDSQLAHISPDEIRLLDQFHGGTEINPGTGLPQYGWLGNLLKGLVRAGAAIGGGMIGGPLGAAAGSGIATKLTGGSWNDALTGAALSGIGGELTQGLSGGGWNPMQSFSAASAAGDVTQNGLMSAAHATPGVMDAAGHMSPTLFQSAMQAPATFSAGNLGSQFLAAAKTAPGIVAGLGALSVPINSGMPAAVAGSSGPVFGVKPMQRTQVPYTQNGGDLTKYGFGPMHRWYEQVNPPPVYTTPVAGGVDYSGTDYGAPQGYAEGGQPQSLASPYSAALSQAAQMGYMAAKRGGQVHVGAVHGDDGGQDDTIDAKLSPGEFVFDADSVSAMGDGNTNAGVKKLEAMRQQLRSKKRAAPKSKIPPKTGALPKYIGRAA